MDFMPPTPNIPNLADQADRRAKSAAFDTARYLIAYDLTLRMEGLLGSTEPLSEERAKQVYAKALALADQMD